MNGSSTLSAQLVHLSPGRLRLRVGYDDFGTPTLRRAEKSVSALPGVRSVQLNPLARSVVLLYDEGSIDSTELMAALGRSGFRVSQSSDSADDGLLSRPLHASIDSVFGRADLGVRRRTRGFADLRTLVPVTLAALAAREILSGRFGAAPWYVLLWYSFSTYVNLHRQTHSRGERVGDA